MSAIKDEAQDATVAVEFRGHTYTLPANLNEADGDVLECYEDDKPISALKALLGEAQFSEYKTREKPRVKDHLEFMEVCFKSLGTSTGE
ncbi:hypothetical protein ACFP2T_35745 [Plantactinospora solaniradicis]|uniref:Uncharacterized protein n=1 Tax=Plantactinospora solaniradicis TaxID=1723736 RepID=A0ABW1KIV4_9ACTN